LNEPVGLAFDGSGDLYVANFGNSKISEFNSSGQLLRAFSGSGLTGPEGLAVDSAGNLYVAYGNLHMVAEYNSTGTLLTSHFVTGVNFATGLAFDGSGNLYVANGSVVSEFNSSGTSINHAFASALLGYGVAFDDTGDLYVVNNSGNSVWEYNSSGQRIEEITDPSLNGPTFIAISPEAVPEPCAWMLLSGGLAALLGLRRRN